MTAENTGHRPGSVGSDSPGPRPAPERPAASAAGPEADAEWLRFVSRAGRMGAWTIDLRTNELYGSVLFSDRFGYGRTAAFDWAELERAIHPDDRAGWRASLERALATETEFDTEYRVRRPDGDYAWLHVRAQIARAPDGTPIRMMGVTLDITERRQAELRLELSEEALRLATEAAEIGTWDLDLETNVLTWSDRTKAMFGISPHVPCSLDDFYAGLHPDDRAFVTAAFASAIDPAIRAVYDVEYRTVGKEDGVIRWVAAKGKGLFQDGRCRRALGTAIDITARKRAAIRQSFLLELADRMRTHGNADTLLETVAHALGRHLGANRVGFGHVQPDGRTIEVMTHYTDGVPPLSGLHRLDDFGPEHAARQRQGLTAFQDDVSTDPTADPDIWAALQTRSFISVPLVRDGRFSACLFAAFRAPHHWERDEVTLVEDVAGRTWDAMQRAWAEEALRLANEALEDLVAERTAALRTSEARLRTVFATSHQLQALLSLDGRLLEANAKALAVIDARPEDVIGTPFWETPWFTGTQGMPEMIRDAVMAARDGQSVHREITLQLPAGPRTYDFALRPIADETGTVVAIVPEATEITERRQAEDALRQAQKMEAIGQLTGGLAHDFNNMLTAIMGSLELLAPRIAGAGPGAAKFLAMAQDAAQRASALTQRLMAFARRQPLSPERVDAGALILGMEELLRRTLTPAIEVRMQFPDGLWPTLCDPNQFENAILNLAINARDAMPEGGRLTIAADNIRADAAYIRLHGADMAPGEYVRFTVTDTGIGMPPEIMARVFDPFFTTKPAGQGTGLGLSMIYGFAKQSGGDVQVASQPGRGTTFTLYLPRFNDRDISAA